MQDVLGSMSLLLVLLNPFLLILYLIDVVETLDRRQFARVLLRAGAIATLVFCAFAILGEVLFTNVLHTQFASFQIFGGVIFLLIGLQFVFRGPKSIEMLRGTSAHLAGAIAMPILIGPGTLSASILIGRRLDTVAACIAVLGAVLASILVMIGLKVLHDIVRSSREALVERYIEIAGRILALVVGTVAVEMIMQGLEAWARSF